MENLGTLAAKMATSAAAGGGAIRPDRGRKVIIMLCRRYSGGGGDPEKRRAFFTELGRLCDEPYGRKVEAIIKRAITKTTVRATKDPARYFCKAVSCALEEREIYSLDEELMGIE